MRLAGVAGGAIALGGVPAWAQLAAGEGRERKRVVVIGAGLAGLVCAYQLGRLGHDVVVLEARRAAGGRVRTDRSFADGMIAEQVQRPDPPPELAAIGHASLEELEGTGV